MNRRDFREGPRWTTGAARRGRLGGDDGENPQGQKGLGEAIARDRTCLVYGPYRWRGLDGPRRRGTVGGILDPSRAIDWSHAGIPGGIPNRTTICASLDPGSSAAQIDAAIAACPADQVVFLTAGTFTLSAGLNMKSDVTLRGAGATRTKLVFTGTTPCDRGPPPYPVICLKGSFSWAGGVENSADWTAGYAKGTTVITLSNTANLRAGESFLILDQVDDAADNGDIYNCGVANGCVSQGSDGMRTAPGGYRNQRQIVKVAAIAGNQVTITPGIYMPNWRSSQAPQAWWPTTVLRRAGIENMTIQPVDGGGGINIQNAMECWITGVRSVKVAPPGGPGGGRNHVWLTMTRGNEIRSNYFYGSGGQSQSWGGVVSGLGQSRREQHLPA